MDRDTAYTVPWRKKGYCRFLLLPLILRLLPLYIFLIFPQPILLTMIIFKNSLSLFKLVCFPISKGDADYRKINCIFWKIFPPKHFPNSIFTKKEGMKASCISGYKMPHYCPSQSEFLSGSKKEPWGQDKRLHCIQTHSRRREHPQRPQAGGTQAGSLQSPTVSQLPCSPTGSAVAWQRNS